MNEQPTRAYTAIVYGDGDTISKTIVTVFARHHSPFYLAEHREYIHQFVFADIEHPGILLQVHISEKTRGHNILLILCYAENTPAEKQHLTRSLNSFLKILLPALADQNILVRSTNAGLNKSMLLVILLAIAMCIIIVAAVKSSVLYR